MCLAIPARVTELKPDNLALIEMEGVSRDVSVELLDEVAVGDYVIVHAGYAISRLDPEEAAETLKLFAQMAEAGIEVHR